MKILLCLLSDQHVPNLLSVHHFKPDRLVLVESSAMKRKGAAENLLKALQLGGLAYPDRCHVQPLDHEDDLEAVRKALQQAYGRFPADDWVANLTGGTKPMSIAAYEFFKAVGARLVYVNIPSPNRFLGLDGLPPEICPYRPSIREFLAGYGFESRKTDEDLRKAEIRARSWWDCARLVAACDPEPALIHFDGLSRDEKRKKWNDARKKGLDLQPDHFGPASLEVRAEAVRCFDLQHVGESLRGRLDKYAARFLTGEWLEVFLWGLLERHAAALDLWDVRLGLTAGKICADTDNEFDVAFMREHSLGMIECKSGSQGHDPDADILHKVEAVVRQFRALRVRSYLATTSANVLDHTGALKHATRNRADLYGCRVWMRDQIRQLARNPDNPELIRPLLDAGE